MFKQMICKNLPTAMCHSSCLAALPNGSLLCVWFGGSREGAADTEIYYSVGKPFYFENKTGRPGHSGSHIHDGQPEGMLMYGKEASNRKQEIDRQHYTIPNQRPKDKHCGKI